MIAEIIQMIELIKYVSEPVCDNSNLFTDLAFDSLAFIDFLLLIEDRYFITFELIEMAECLNVGRLAAVVEAKVKERNGLCSEA